MKKTSFILLLWLSFAATLVAQNPHGKSFDQIFDEMERNMQRGIPNQKIDTIQIKPGQKQYFQMSPDSSSYFYFKVDTSFNGGSSMQQFFQFGNPFGNDQMDGGFGNFNDIFRQMEEMQRQLFGLPSNPQAPNADHTPDDGLLPEERIRQREEDEKLGIKPTTPAKTTKPKIKTTRI
jgi:hypothetical protein